MDYTVAAVDEAINLLLLVAAEPGLGVTEISRRVGITKGRAFRLLTTLEQRDLVTRHGAQASYHLSFQALYLGAAASEQIDLTRLVQEPLDRLGAVFNESIVVRIRDGLETVCVARWESTQSLQVHAQIGNRRPLYAGASSKLLLAYAPPEVLEVVLASERKRFTDTTPVSAQQLLQELARVRKQDYAISIGERTPDTAAIAVPIRDNKGEVVAALSISTPVSRMKKDRIAPYLEQLNLRAREISRGLGHIT